MSLEATQTPSLPDDADALRASIASLTAHFFSAPEDSDTTAISTDALAEVAFEEQVFEEREVEAPEASIERGPTPTAPTRIIPSTSRKYPTLASMAAVAPHPARAEQTGALRSSATEAENTPSQPSSPHWARADESTGGQKWAALEAHEASVMRGLAAADEMERLDPIGANDESQWLRSRGRPVEGGNTVLAVAACQAALVAIAALVGALLLIGQQPLAIWPWIFAAFAGLGGWLAYALGQDAAQTTFAGGVLLASQAGMLGWAFALLGPRASLLAIVPPLMLLALRMAGRATATAWALIVLVVYCAFLTLAAGFGLHPALRLDAGAAALLDGVFVAVGLILTLVGIFRMGERVARAEAMGALRWNEARALRERVIALQRRGAEDAERLYELTEAAMRGRRRDLAPLDPGLRVVADRLRVTAERVAAMREEHTEHQKLEAALRRLTRSLERGWLGLAWTWPRPNGTLVDELLALLRAPRPRDGHAPRSADASTPSGLLHIPTTDAKLAAQERTQTLPGRSRSATQGASTGEFAQALTQPLPVPPKANAPLRWEEWDEWRDWRHKHD